MEESTKPSIIVLASYTQSFIDGILRRFQNVGTSGEFKEGVAGDNS